MDYCRILIFIFLVWSLFLGFSILHLSLLFVNFCPFDIWLLRIFQLLLEFFFLGPGYCSYLNLFIIAMGGFVV